LQASKSWALRPRPETFAVDIHIAWPYKSCNIIASLLIRRGRPIGGLDGYETKDCEEAGEKSGGQSGKAHPQAKDGEAREEEREESTWESEG
jgi:hypothetical protein